MKLGELKSAIRSNAGAPQVCALLPDGRPIWVKVQKSSLMEALDLCFEHKNSETGLRFAGDRLNWAFPPSRPAPPPPAADDLDLSEPDDGELDLSDI